MNVKDNVLVEKDFNKTTHSNVGLSPDVQSDIENGLWSDAFSKTSKSAGKSSENVYTVRVTLIKDRLKDKGLAEYLDGFMPKNSGENKSKFSVDINTPFYIAPSDKEEQQIKAQHKSWYQRLLFGIPIGWGKFDFKTKPFIPVINAESGEIISTGKRESYFVPVQTLKESFTLAESVIDDFIDNLVTRSYFRGWFNVEKVKVNASDVGKSGNAFEEVVKQYILTKGGVSEDVAGSLIKVVSHIIKGDPTNVDGNPLLNFMFHQKNIDNKFLEKPETTIKVLKALMSGLSNNAKPVTPNRLKNVSYIAYNPSLWKQSEQEILNILGVYNWLALEAQYSSDLGRKSGFDALQAEAGAQKDIVKKDGTIDYPKLMSAILYKDGNNKGNVRPYSEMKDLLDNLQINPEEPDDVIKRTASASSSSRNGNNRTSGRNQEVNVPDEIDPNILKELGIDVTTFNNNIKGRNSAQKKAHLLKLLKDAGIIK